MARKLTTAERRWHRKMAAGLFNEVWRLLEKKRTPAEDDRMIHAAHASRYHWGEVGTPVNLAIGEWQISHVYAVLDRPEPATYHAVRSLATCKENGIDDFPLAFAYEALARADAVAGRKRELRRHLALAREAGSKIKDKEDRDLLFQDPKPFRHESGLVDEPNPDSASPIRRRMHDVNRLLEGRGIKDERLELPAFPARVDAPRFLQPEEIPDDAIVPSPAEPARVEALRRHAGEGDVEACLEIIVHESPRVAAPERREDAEPDLLGDPIHPGVLIVRRDGPDDHAFHVNPVEDPSQRVELALLPRRGGLADQGDSHRLRLERGEVQVRRVEEHGVAVLRRD